MRKLLMLAALLVPMVSQAQFSLGLRVGYAPAMGDAAKDSGMKEFALKSQIPIQLDALYKVTRDIGVGAYFAYGLGQTDGSLMSPIAGEMLGSPVPVDICGEDLGDGKVECSGRSMRFGVQGVYTFNNVKFALVPWAGLSLGYEMTSVEAKDNADKLTLDLNGFDLGLQAGGDSAINENFAIGPYISFNIGQYRNAEFKLSSDPNQNDDGSIDDKAFHEWFGFGIRGKFDL
jgi:hypothetical protein